MIRAQTGRSVAIPAEAAPAEAENAGLAFNLYLLFMVSWFLHMPARVPLIGLLRIDLLLLCTIAALISINSANGTTKTSTKVNTLILVLVSYVIATLPFVEWPGTVIKGGLPDYAKALVFYYFTSRLITTERRLVTLLLVFVVSQLFRVLEPVYLHVTQGYWGSAASMLGGAEMMPRLSGAPNDVINPNGLAFVIVTLIPFLHHIWTLRRLGTVAYLTLIPILLYALGLTGSRSGFLALAITFATIWLRSRRKLLLGAVAIVAVLVGMSYLSPDEQDRYRSIVDSNTKNAQTAQGRIDGMYADFQVAMRRPLFGYGLGTSREANVHFSQRNIPSHNLITQVLQELGAAGLTLFLLLLITIFRNVHGILRDFRQAPISSLLLQRLARALEVWLVMNLLFSVFSYGLASYEWYFIAGLAEVAMRLRLAHLAPGDCVRSARAVNSWRPAYLRDHAAAGPIWWHASVERARAARPNPPRGWVGLP